MTHHLTFSCLFTEIMDNAINADAFLIYLLIVCKMLSCVQCH